MTTKIIIYCGVCGNEIDTNKEYCRLTQWDNKGNFFKESFYHVSCYSNDRDGELKEKTKKILNKLNIITDRI